MNFLFYESNKKNKKPVKVQVLSEHVTIHSSDGNQPVLTINIEDAVGCHIVQDSLDSGTKSVHLKIFYYPLVSSKRKRTIKIVYLQPVLSGEDGFQECLKLKVQILCATRGIPAQENNDFALQAVNSLQKLLIFINPKSGKGQARKIFSSKIAVMLAEADICYDAVFTTGQNHARRLVKNADLSDHRGIVVVSGDGLLFEVINGLLERSDWESAIKIPIGIIPQGSGNGTARTLADAQNEPYHSDPVLGLTLGVIRARNRPMDLMRVLQRSSDSVSRTYYAILSVGYGLLSDIDIESETLRSLGEARFAVWAVRRLLNLRTYKLKISYLPAAVTDEGTSLQPTRLRPRLLHSTTTLDEIGHEKPVKRALSVGDEVEEGVDIREGDAFFTDVPEEEKVGDYVFGPTSDYPPLGEEVPKDWLSLEGDFVMVYGVCQKYIGTDLMFAPKSKLSDGLIFLCLVRAGATKTQLLQFLSGMEDGSHVNVPCCEMIPVKAFRLEPATSDGCLTIDGERLPTAPIQVEILPSMLNFLSR